MKKIQVNKRDYARLLSMSDKLDLMYHNQPLATSSHEDIFYSYIDRAKDYIDKCLDMIYEDED